MSYVVHGKYDSLWSYVKARKKTTNLHKDSGYHTIDTRNQTFDFGQLDMIIVCFLHKQKKKPSNPKKENSACTRLYK